MKRIIVLIVVMMICFKAGIARVQLLVPTTVYAGEATIINCTSSVQNFREGNYPIIMLKAEHGCTINRDDALGRPIMLNNHYQKSFNITCVKGNHTLRCMTNRMTGKLKFQVIERPPKVVNKPLNITTNVGLPVTLTCCVEGDPKHYWVGWMSRQAVIQPGEEHSISAYQSANGTVHHLTIYSVKEAGKYECKVYAINGNELDQVTHHVTVDDGEDDAGQAGSSSLWDILKRFF